MKDRRIPGWVVAAVAAGLLALLAIAAIGAADIPSRSGDALLPFDGQTIKQVIADVALLFIAAAVIWFLLPNKGTKKRRPQSDRNSVLAAVLMLTVMLFVFLQIGKHARDAQPDSGTVVSLPEVQSPTPSSIPPSSTRAAGSPDILLFVVGGVILAAVFVAALRRAPDVEEEPPAPPAVVGVIDELLAELEQSPDPRHVVISAYGRMEQALAQDGIARRRSEAPFEYLQRALDRLHVSSQSVARLTDLFSEARFSPHEIDDTMASEARAALRDVRNELGVLT
jgi:hypothetical protein